MRKLSIVVAVAVALAAAPARAGDAEEAVLYKNPQCVCCAEYGRYLEAHGYTVRVEETEELEVVKRIAGVPPELAACHTVKVGGYVIEGHVPMSAIEKLMEEKPPIRGIALPGMPLGSPGMGGEKSGPFRVYEISDEPKVFAVE